MHLKIFLSSGSGTRSLVHDSLGVSNTPCTWLLSIIDFPQPYYRYFDLNIEPYRNAGALVVHNLKVHEKGPHVEINSSLNPIDSLQEHLLHEV
jgi:hypothetical protein